MIVGVIQARTGSRRFPNKVLGSLAGHPMLWHVIRRLRRTESLDRIVVAVPPADRDMLRPVVEAAGGELMAPDVAEDDLLGRHAAVGRLTSAEWIVRVPADNPCVEPAEVDRIVAAATTAAHGGAWSNLHAIEGSGYPDGIGAEVYPMLVLRVLDRLVVDPRRREHPHVMFEDHRDMRTIPCPALFARPDVRLDVNTEADFIFIRAIYEALYPLNERFHITDILAFLDREPVSA